MKTVITKHIFHYGIGYISPRDDAYVNLTNNYDGIIRYCGVENKKLEDLDFHLNEWRRMMCKITMKKTSEWICETPDGRLSWCSECRYRRIYKYKGL